MERIDFRLADSQDNEGILRLLHSMTMPGEIELLYKKSPDFFHAAEIQGFAHQALVACREDGEIVALGTRSLKHVYVNGIPQVIGYLGDLRISPHARHLHILANGYAEMGRLMTDGRALLHLTTIVEGNRNAKAALTWKNRHRSIPTYHDLGRIDTSFVFPVLWKHRRHSCQIRRGCKDNLPEIVDFLRHIAVTRQFYPVYTCDFFQNLRDFQPENFYLAYQNNRLVGVTALWDQTGFKQMTVKKYNGKMALFKRFLGRILPDEETEISHAYLSFIAIQDDDPDIFGTLLSHIYNDVRHSGIRYFIVGFHERDPLGKAMKGYPKLTYQSRLYAADYKEDAEIQALLDPRIPYVEIATL